MALVALVTGCGGGYQPARAQFAFLGYYQGTQLQRVILGGPMTSGPSSLAKGDVVTVDGTRVRSAVLAGARELDGKTYADGDHLTFDDLGKVRTRKSKAEAEQAAARSAKSEAAARAERKRTCDVKCGPDDSCRAHCTKYGY